MPTIIQTQLIIEPNWAEVTKKAKNLEHIIRRCDPPATALPIITGAGAVPGLYSHITQSQDQDSDGIPKPLKSTKSKGGKKSRRDKAKPQQQPQPPPLPLKKRNPMNPIMRISEVIAEAADHIGVNKAAKGLLEDPNKGEGNNKTIIGANTRVTMDNLTPPAAAITITITAVIIEAEVDMVMVVIITEVASMDKAAIKAITITNTISITHMMMVHRLSNMAHHAHFAVILITLPNTVLKESMT